MRHIPAMVDMRRTPAEAAEAADPVASAPLYPYGLCLCLCTDELQKLNLDDEDVEVGDFIHMHVLAKVTSVSKTDTETAGPQCRVELQITNIAAESEDDENEEADEAEGRRGPSKLYG